MSAVALFAFSLTAAAASGQSSPVQRAPAAPPPECPATAGRQGEPVCPGSPQPIPIPYPNTRRITPPRVNTGPIRASTGDEAGTARREIAPPAGPAAPDAAAVTGRPVGQPAAAGLGAHVQRDPPPPARPGAAERSPD